MSTSEAKPKYVQDLEAVFGLPSDAGFGSAVFFRRLAAEDELEQVSIASYQAFLGDSWDEWGKTVWLAPWRQVYARPQGAETSIVAELNAIDDHDAALSVPLLLSVLEAPNTAGKALAAAYDTHDVVDVRVYTIGDGDMMSGLLLAGRRVNNDTTFLTLLMD